MCIYIYLCITDTIHLMSYKMSIFLSFVLFFVSCVAACDRCVHQSNAAYFQDESALYSGACGYGPLALGLNGGYLAGAARSLYKGGAGCGSCYHIRCKNPKLCRTAGVKVIVSDINTSDQTGFVLSEKAFTAMAYKGLGQQILNLGIVDVEYKRIPCEYKNKTIVASLEEASQRPYYFAMKFLYQAGQTDILSVEISPAGTPNWVYMRRRNGAVWDTSSVPVGPLQYRMLVTSGSEGAYIYPSKLIPGDWKGGIGYDSGNQTYAIAQEACSPCDHSIWR